MIEVIRITNDISTSNTYIIKEKDKSYCWIIDIGDVSKIEKCIVGLSVKGVFITHTHFDHIYGINKFLEKHPESVVYTSKKGQISLANTKFNLSKYHNSEIEYKGDSEVLFNNDSIQIFPNINLIVYDTPGHDWSCLTYKVGDYLFTGDSYIPGLKVVTIFPRANKTKAEESLNLIYSLIDDDSIICPGHGEMIKSSDL